MARSTIKKHATTCGLLHGAGGRAKVVGRDGNKLTYRWPCGYEKTEVLMHGPGRLRKPAPADLVAFFARYWAQGVTYECPRCRRKSLAEKRMAGKGKTKGG
jgi:hypothetical protein